MKIGQNKVVEISYAVEVEGKIVDQMTEEKPLDYIHGGNMLLPKFEETLEGQEPGYEFAFSLSPADGYGEYEEARVVEIPKTAFVVDGKLHEEVLAVGNTIPMLNGEGQVVPGRVLDVKDQVVVMDFNHPMAGKTLNFTGKVISVREVTEKELKEGLHGEFLPQEHGCGGCHGGCHGGCGGHGDGECGCGGGCHNAN